MATNQPKLMSIDKTLAKILEEERSQLNQMYYTYKLNFPSLEPEAFKSLFIDFVMPLLTTIEVNLPYSNVKQTVVLLYEVLLKLLGKDFLGKNSKYPDFGNILKETFLSIPNTLALSNAIIPSVINAIYNISVVHDKNARDWKDSMLRVSTATNDPDIFLKAGMLASWKCGLAHYRVSALEIAGTLPEDILYLIFDTKKIKDQKPMQTAIDSMLNDPWLSFENALDAGYKKTGFEIRVVDKFSGYGGKVTRQPNISFVNGDFILSMGATDYKLFSDIYGSVLLKTSLEDILSEEQELVSVESITYKNTGEVSYKHFKRTFPEIQKASSIESFGTTLVVSVPFSYNIYAIYLK
jgi:hypothetical protein